MPTKTINSKTAVGASQNTVEVSSSYSSVNTSETRYQCLDSTTVKYRQSSKTEFGSSSRLGTQFHNRAASPSYNYLLNQPTCSKFIGSFIHEHSLESRAKQRPSKRARQRMRKRLEKLKLEEGKSKNSTESGYDTTSGDCQTPGIGSPKKGALNLQAAKESRPNASIPQKSEQNKSIPPKNKHIAEENTNDGRIHSRTTSASSVGSLNIADKSLKKLLKDLHRCEVSIGKYEALLSEECGDGVTQLREVFTTLRRNLDTRESDLNQELKAVQESAAAILQRRKNTAQYLKQASEQLNTLEEAQITELKQQIKQFVTDRKVDEEIGTITRFQADADDMLPQIMGFGKVNNVRHLYTEWEENPGEAIELSKHRLSFSLSTLGHHRFSSSSFSEATSSPSHSVHTDTDAPDNSESAFNEVEGDDKATETGFEKTDDSESEKADKICPVQERDERHTSEQSSAANQAAIADSKSDSTSDSGPQIATKTLAEQISRDVKVVDEKNRSPTSDNRNIADNPCKKQTKGKKATKKDTQEKKMSAAELIKKQSRVRESLQMQGVFLYDPITGEGPPPTPLLQTTPTDMTIAVYERSTSPSFRKKKTPTQLRRERKKRQKERERRQSELERKLREGTIKNNNVQSSSDSITPELPSTDKNSNTSEFETGSPESSSNKNIRKRVKPALSGEIEENDRDASGESSDFEYSEPTDQQPGEMSMSTLSDLQPTEASTNTLSDQQPAEASTDTLSDLQPTEASTNTLSAPQPSEASMSTLSGQQPAEANMSTLSDQQPAEASTNTLSDQQPAETSTDTLSDQQPSEASMSTLSDQQPTEASMSTLSDQQPAETNTNMQKQVAIDSDSDETKSSTHNNELKSCPSTLETQNADSTDLQEKLSPLIPLQESNFPLTETPQYDDQPLETEHPVLDDACTHTVNLEDHSEKSVGPDADNSNQQDPDLDDLPQQIFEHTCPVAVTLPAEQLSHVTESSNDKPPPVNLSNDMIVATTDEGPMNDGSLETTSVVTTDDDKMLTPPPDANPSNAQTAITSDTVLSSSDEMVAPPTTEQPNYTTTVQSTPNHTTASITSDTDEIAPPTKLQIYAEPSTPTDTATSTLVDTHQPALLKTIGTVSLGNKEDRFREHKTECEDVDAVQTSTDKAILTPAEVTYTDDHGKCLDGNDPSDSLINECLHTSSNDDQLTEVPVLNTNETDDNRLEAEPSKSTFVLEQVNSNSVPESDMLNQNDLGVEMNNTVPVCDITLEKASDSAMDTLPHSDEISMETKLVVETSSEKQIERAMETPELSSTVDREE